MDAASAARRRVDAACRSFRANPAARLTMWKELAALLEHFDLAASLQIIRQGHSEEGTRPYDLIASVAESWIPRVRAPQPFADVIHGAVSERERLIIAVGQDKADLAGILRRMYRAENTMYEVKARWRAAFREPLMLIVASWAMLVGYAYLVLWQLSLYPEKPRGLVLTAYNGCHWLLWWGAWLIPLALALFALSVLWLLRHWHTRGRTACEVLWPFGLYKALHAADFLLAFSILQGVGEDLPASLRAMAKIGGSYLRWQIEAMEPLARTKSIGFSFRQTGRRFPDSLVNALLDVFSRDDPGHFPEHLERVAEQFSADLVLRMEVSRKATILVALAIAGLLQVLITLLMVAISLPTV
jgi:type II secretory pathway component PulF